MVMIRVNAPGAERRSEEKVAGEEEGGVWGGCDFGEEEEASLVLFGARC